MANNGGTEKKVEAWWTRHGGTIIAFVGAGGALVHSVAPGIAEASGEWLGTALVGLGIAGAVIQSYLRGEGE